MTSDQGTKYGDQIPDDHCWEDDEQQDDAADDSDVSVEFFLTVNDTRDEIEKYNGLQWNFLFDDGMITAVDKSHYCPGPGHTDPMGFREWGDVPEQVQAAALDALNVDEAREVVDVEATEEVSEDQWP